jgi:hypothetical protein
METKQQLSLRDTEHRLIFNQGSEIFGVSGHAAALYINASVSNNT